MYRRYVTAESYAHPAKASFGLLHRIYDHLEALDLLKSGDTVIDFMSGSGRMNLMAALRGYKTVGVELEPHFIKMCEDNKRQTEHVIGRTVDWKIIQGDSRRLSEILDGCGGVGITSSPYGNRLSDNDKREHMDAEGRFRRPNTAYGGDKLNIGNLPDNEKLVGVTSAPYESSISGGKSGIEWQAEWGKQSESRQPSQNIEYSGSRDNIGNLRDKGGLVGVTSAPYESSDCPRHSDPESYRRYGKNIYRPNQRPMPSGQANIANDRSETYASAMLQVYSEAFKAGISPLISITKNPTKNHALKRLDILTADLLIRAGYRIVDVHRAVLFKVNRDATLDGGTAESYKGRLSFFKRLSLRVGNTASMWEDVLFAVNPEKHSKVTNHLLVDVDGQIPNLALMKISAWAKNRGIV